MTILKWLMPFCVVGAMYAQTPGQAPETQPGRAPAAACRCPALESMIASQQQEAAELARAITALRARMTMLRNDAGTLNNQQVRDALQLDAEMWNSLIELLQSRADRLQNQNTDHSRTR